jgi:hypothetical protein
MGIEPTRTALQSLRIAVFHEAPTGCVRLACENFHVTRDNVGLRKTTPPFAIEFPLSTLARTSDGNFVRSRPKNGHCDHQIAYQEAATRGHRTCYGTTRRTTNIRIAAKIRSAKPTTAGRVH